MRPSDPIHRSADPSALALAIIQGDWVSPWENSNFFAVARDTTGAIISVNRAFARKFGRPTGAWQGFDLIRLLHAQDQAQWQGLVAQLHKAPHRIEHETRWMTAQGWRWISWEETALLDESGAISLYRSVGQDVTREHQASEHAYMLTSAVEQSPVGILLTDLVGAAHYVNPTFTNVTGYSLEDLMNRQRSVLRDAHPSDEAYHNFMADIRAGKEWHGEAQFTRRDGGTVWENLHVSAVRNHQGTITHLLCLREDITERKRLEAQLRQAQKMESIGTLAGGIAHDFNNMLAIINGYAEVCMTRPAIQQDEVLKRYMREIHGAAQRAVGLVQRILTFSRKAEVRVIPLHLNKLLRELGNLLSETFPRTVCFDLDLQDNLPQLLADQNQMQQVIMNLCVNARDAMPKGGTITIQTRVCKGVELAQLQANPALDYVCLQVSDTGIGIPQEIIQRIFEPFFTTKQDSGGTGLGLAMVYGIIQSHNGLLDVRSTPGVGSSFILYFPISAHAPEQAVVPQQRVLSEFPGGSESVLVVEDELSLRNLLCNVLGPCGYTVHTARDGGDALSIIRDKSIRIDAVILDLNMPQVHGIEVYRDLIRVRPGTPALVVSGNITTEMQAELTQLGQKHFIHKPYRLEEICGRLRQVLDKH